MNGWRCFNEGLPNCIVTSMEINYCRNELVAGTYGRGIWKTKLTLPKQNRELVIRNNQTWSTDKVILSDIRIRKNKTLEIQGKLKMAEGTKFILEKNAKVLIDETNLDCLCENTECGKIVRDD